ncbi:MAG: carboxypeptidase regulatory-like domain-containing protein [Nitrospirae bacterium]|nr:carboxypeptidase regulatory-like domain-containing protein [Nitrospirota bacterium]MBI3593801.1 carboxypeptidase regulatory-like domain-containing protein [Nitrospirota bacterium]
MFKLTGVICGTLLFMSAFLLPDNRFQAWAYEETLVKDAGTYSGKVTLSGVVPPPRRFHLITFPNMEFCGTISDGNGDRLLREFHVSDKGEFKNVVVLFVGVSKGKAFNYTPELKIENCLIDPFVAPVRNNHPIKIESKDPIVHDVQTYTLKDDYTFAMFNKPMLPNSTEIKEIRFRPNHYIFRVQCGVHSYMQNWGIAIGNPYFSVTGEEGSFSIGDIPPGEYDVIAWHPLMTPVVHRVKIAPGEEKRDLFVFSSKDVVVPYHDLQTGYRFDTALIPSKMPKPTILIQR